MPSANRKSPTTSATGRTAGTAADARRADHRPAARDSAAPTRRPVGFLATPDARNRPYRGDPDVRQRGHSAAIASPTRLSVLTQVHPRRA